MQKATAKNDAAVKASLIVAEEIARVTKHFFGGHIFEKVLASSVWKAFKT